MMIEADLRRTNSREEKSPPQVPTAVEAERRTDRTGMEINSKADQEIEE